MRTIGCPASIWRAGTRPAVTAGRRRSALLVTPTLAVAAIYLVHFGRGIGLGCYRIDLEVYRAGATVVLHGGDLYGPLPRLGDGHQLPFTYPPFAALTFIPLGVLGYGMANWLLALSLLAAALAVTGMRGALKAGQVTSALSLNAVAGLLISPISWSHNWVWAAPALLTYLATTNPNRRRPPTVAVLALLIFAIAPHWLLPTGGGRELHWAWWQQAAGDSYTLTGLAALTHAASSRLLPRPEHRYPGPASASATPHDQELDRYRPEPATTRACRRFGSWDRPLARRSWRGARPSPRCRVSCDSEDKQDEQPADDQVQPGHERLFHRVRDVPVE